jgi:PAS domain S-box-containing protein
MLRGLSVHGRVALAVGLVVVLAQAVLTGIELTGIPGEVRAAKEQELAKSATDVSIAIADALWELNRDAVRKIMSGFTNTPDFVAARVMDDAGHVLYEIGDVLAAPDRLSRSQRVTIKIGDRERTIGQLTLTSSLAELPRRVNAVARERAIEGAIQLAVIMSLSLGVTALLLRPLGRITWTMLQIAKGVEVGGVPYRERRDQVGRIAGAAEAFRAAMKARLDAEKALRQARDELEERVRQRTLELTLRNQDLVHEIAHRETAQAALAQSEGRLRGMINNFPASILLKDFFGRIQLINASYSSRYGHSEQSAIGRQFAELHPAEQVAFDDALDHHVRETGTVITRETKAKTEAGTEIEVSVTRFPVFGADGQLEGLGSIAIDVTEQKLTERKLEQSQRLEALGKLTGGVAHDFNNLLGVILGNAELIELELGRDDTRVREIMTATDRAAHLVRSLLAFARKQSLRPSRTDLNTVVTAMAAMLRRVLGEPYEVRLKLLDGLWPVLIDGAQLESAVLNLALNARDAMPNGGRLCIGTYNRIFDQPEAIGGGEMAAGEYVELALSDTGTGMTPDVAARAFEPFFTTKEIAKGSGLGLSMVYGFVKQSGGYIRLYSELDRGTTVKLYLPREMGAESLSVPAVAGQDETIPRGAGELVLVVEDNEGMRAFSTGALESLGYRVRVAVDAESALAALDDAAGTIALLFTDVVLGSGMDGFALARAACLRDPELKVLFTTGFADPSLPALGEPVPDSLILSKPFRLADLAGRLASVLGPARKSAPADST